MATINLSFSYFGYKLENGVYIQIRIWKLLKAINLFGFHCCPDPGRGSVNIGFH
jgi:hypothetical protein